MGDVVNELNNTHNDNNFESITNNDNNDNNIRITLNEASSLTNKSDNNIIQPYNHDTIILNVNYNNIKAKALIDTGATHTFVNQRFIDKNNIQTSSITNSVQLANGKRDNITEIVNNAIIKLQNKTIKIDTLVLKTMNEKYDVVIGIDYIQQSKLSIDVLILKRSLQHNKQYNNIDNNNIEHNEINTNTIKLDPPFKWNALEQDDIQLCEFDNIEIVDKSPLSSIQCNSSEINSDNNNTKLKHDPLSTLTGKQRRFILQFSDVYPSTMPKGLPPIRQIQHDIKLIDNTKIHVKPAYRCSKQQQDLAAQTIKEMLDSGIIRRSSSPHGAPVLFIKKSDGSYRMVVDYKLINSNTITDSTHLPNIKDSFDRLEGSKIFSKIDFSSGFHQVRMNDESIDKTAFNCRQGHFEYLVMPMGLKNSPATFTKLMQSIFSNVSDEGILIYLDDILIYSKSESEHYKLIDIIFKTLRKHKLYIKLSKCEFFKSELEFLGHRITGDGKNPVLDKVKKAVDFPPPTTLRQVKRFNGLLNWYRDFIPNFSEVALPITNLLKGKNQLKNNKIKWTEVEQQSFDKLKSLLVSAPTLIPSNHQLDYIIHTDASDYAIGAVLEQNDGSGNRPISFMSEKLNDHQINYPTHEKELYAIYKAIFNWRCYIEGGKVIVYTDNKGLQYLQTQSTVNSRQARWLLEIFRHNIEIRYKPGINNHVADALSRRQDYQLNDIQLIRTDGIYKDIIKAQQSDELCKLLMSGKTINKQQQTKLPLHCENGIIHQQNRLYIPKHHRHIITSILDQFHDQQCHIGIDKTIEHIKRSYYWTDLDKDVTSYINQCLQCIKNKPILKHKAGLLQSHSIPPKCWHTITVDFVTGLPRSRKTNNDSFVVFTDKLSKMIHIAPMKTTHTAIEFAHIMFATVVKYHGHPEVIISDRDTRFTSKFWCELMRLTGTKLIKSSAYHPMTDGQSERSNQTVESLLKSLVNNECNDWESKLDLVEYTVNNSINASTKMTPFYINYHQHPSNPYDYNHHSELEQSSVPAAHQTYNDILNNINKIKTNLLKAQQNQQKYANQKRREVKLNVGDMVMLSVKNISNKIGVDKLRGKYPYGPFKIIEVINDVNYKLDLPSTFKIHNNIHIDRLKLVNKHDDNAFPTRQQYQPPPPPIVREDEQLLYEVEKIIDVKYKNNKPYKYLVKWRGYSDIENSWEPIENLFESMDAINEFHQQQQLDNNNQLINRTSNINTRARTKVNSQSQINNINNNNKIDNTNNNNSTSSIRLLSQNNNNINSDISSTSPSINNQESVEVSGRKWSSHQCNSKTKKQQQCKCTTLKGFKCWRHLQSELNIRIKPSKIKGAGLGLYTATRDFNKDEIITTYEGDISTTPIHGIYVLQVKNNKYINANDSTCLGSFVNSCRLINKSNNECNGNNARFSYDSRNGIVNIKANRRIKKGEEVCISYSKQYWSVIDSEKRNINNAIKRSLMDNNINSTNNNSSNNNNRYTTPSRDNNNNINTNTTIRRSPNTTILKSIINQQSRYNLRSNRNSTQ